MDYKSKYADYKNVKLTFGRYANGRIAMKLLTERGEGILVATVNLPDFPLGGGEVIIKNWSENEGVLEFLIKEGIISPSKREIPTGYVEANVCDLLVNPENYSK